MPTRRSMLPRRSRRPAARRSPSQATSRTKPMSAARSPMRSKSSADSTSWSTTPGRSRSALSQRRASTRGTASWLSTCAGSSSAAGRPRGQMVDQGTGGRIINGSSGAGRRGNALIGAYAASKFGVIGLTQSLAVELAPHGITVNAYCPGHVTSTPMWEQIDRDLTGQRAASRERRGGPQSRRHRSAAPGAPRRSPRQLRSSRRTKRRL